MLNKPSALSSHTKEYHVTSNRISASAGTGKTYQLASRYIALLVLGAAPEEIIALTFTRKAAGEFRNRILHALAEGADNKCDKKTGRNELAVRVWDVLSGLSVEPTEYGAWKTVPASNPVPLLPVTAALVREAADMKQYPENLYNESPTLQDYYKFPPTNAETFAKLLKNMVAVLSKLQLSTIDSFFSSLVTTNSLELGMNQISPLEPAEESLVRAAAIRRYLDDRGASEQTRTDFLEMFSSLTGGVGNHTQSQIESELKNYLRLYRELPPQTRWGSIATFPHAEDMYIATDEQLSEYTNSAAELNSLLNAYGSSITEPKVCNQLRELANGGTYIKKDALKVVSHYVHMPLLNPALQTMLEAFDQEGEPNEEQKEAIRLWENEGSNHLLSSKHKTAIGNVIKKLKNENQRKLTAKQLEGISALKSAALCPTGISDANMAILTRMAQLAETLSKLVIPYKLRAAADRSKNLYKLLSGYAAIYDSRMKADGRLSFDDISRMAKELMLSEPGNEQLLRHHIAYRMGGRFSHWMLDEFQDTSESQFCTLTPLLRPIVEEAGSHTIDFTEEQWTNKMPASLHGRLESKKHSVAGESLFIVGDTKQSIYGFRTGKTEVFERLANEEPWKTPLQPSPLSRSFRSSPVIMNFTNELFKALGKVENQEEDKKDGIKKIPVDFPGDFTEHQAAKDMPGYAEMNFIAPHGDDEDEASQKEHIYDKVAEILHTLTNNDSTLKNGMSIAILVRANDNADEIQKHLRAKMPNLPTLLVKDSLAAAACPMGEILLYFFKWLQHPGDLAALNIVRTSFLSKFIGHKQAQAHADLLQELQDLGYSGMMHKLLTPLPSEDAVANRPIIERWLNEAIAFDTKGATLTEWVQHMKNLSMQAAGASGAVQIMTMHKSKGLEFDAVILPYTSVEATDTTKHLKYFVSDDNNSLILPPAQKEDWSRFGNLFTDMAARWQQRQRKEAYNLLYVAVTRAKHANYIICHGARLMETKTLQSGETREDWKGCAHSIGGLLRQACKWMNPQEEVNYDQLKTDYTYITRGEPTWYESLTPKYTGTEQKSQSAVPGTATPRRKRTSPSSFAKTEDKKTKEPEDFKKSAHVDYGDLTAADFGTLVHAAWEEIIWRDAALLPDWMSAAAPRTLSQSVVYHALQQPEIADFFTAKPNQEVYNEQPIEAITDRDEWLSGTIDRLVLTVDTQGKTTAAHIIDFKTNQRDIENEQSGLALKQEYMRQMSAYREHVAKACDLPLARVSVSLVSCPLGVPAKVLHYTDTELKAST